MRILLFLIAADFAVSQTCMCATCNPRERIQTDWTNVSSACFGSCTFQNTSCSYSQGCRDPKATEWVIGSDSIIMHGYSDVANSYSTLESPLIAIPETSCLTINAFCNSPSSVAILLSNSSDNAFKLAETTHGHTTNLQRDFNLEPATFRILIKGRSGGNADGYVKLSYVRLERGRCEDHGRESYSCDSSSTAITTAASSIYSFTTTSGTKVPSIASPTWQTSEFSGFSQKSPTVTSLTPFSYISEYSSSPSAENNTQGVNDTDVDAIVGSIVSVAIVFLLIIIFAVLWRRRKCHHKSSKDEDNDLEFQKQHPAFIINKERKVTSTVSDVNADGDQHNIFRKDGSVLKTESTNSSLMETKGKHTYTIMNTEDSNKHTYDLIPGDTTSEMFPGDDSVGKFNCKAETVSNDLLTSPNNENEFPTSTVNRDDKGNNARSLGQTEQLNCPDVYSIINKTVKKPVSNEVYNRLDALKPKVTNFTEDKVTNTYNKLNLAKNPVRNTQNKEFNNGTIESSQNEYNVLNFQQKKCNNVADARNEPSDNCDSKQNIYSSADIHTDTYSRVQNDKKERVINSDYDHIR